MTTVADFDSETRERIAKFRREAEARYREASEAAARRYKRTSAPPILEDYATGMVLEGCTDEVWALSEVAELDAEDAPYVIGIGHVLTMKGLLRLARFFARIGEVPTARHLYDHLQTEMQEVRRLSRELHEVAEETVDYAIPHEP